MKFEYLKGKGELVSAALLGVSAVFVVVILVKAKGYFIEPARAEELVKRVMAQSEPNDNDVKEYLAESMAVADELKKKNLFVPPVQKKHPVSMVFGILGDEALINGKWYKAGAKVGDAKIVSVEPTKVTIEWEGKEKVFAPISAMVAAPPPKYEPKEAVEKDKDKPKKSDIDKYEKKKLKDQEKFAASFGKEDPLGWMGVELSPKARKMIMKQWKKASEEERAEAMADWKKMPDDERRKAIGEMEREAGKKDWGK